MMFFKKSLLLAALLAILGTLSAGASESEDRSFQMREFEGRLSFDTLESTIEQDVPVLKDVTITSSRRSYDPYWLLSGLRRGRYIFGFTATVNGAQESFSGCVISFDSRHSLRLGVYLFRCKNDTYYLNQFIDFDFEDLGLKLKKSAKTFIR